MQVLFGGSQWVSDPFMVRVPRGYGRASSALNPAGSYSGRQHVRRLGSRFGAVFNIIGPNGRAAMRVSDKCHV